MIATRTIPCGYVNGKPAYSADEFIYMKRGFGAITDDAELMAFAEKVTHGWYDSGWKRSFTSFYLSDYALNEPKASLTDSEFDRLKEIQRQARAEKKAAEDARKWEYVETIYYADNSVEETWRDKDGNTKQVMVVGPHGDAC